MLLCPEIIRTQQQTHTQTQAHTTHTQYKDIFCSSSVQMFACVRMMIPMDEIKFFNVALNHYIVTLFLVEIENKTKKTHSIYQYCTCHFISLENKSKQSLIISFFIRFFIELISIQTCICTVMDFTC